MRLRQLVFVSKERDELSRKICNIFDLKETFHDPGLINFGLENVLIPLNDTFFEIVMPVRENTTAERFFDKRGGEGGYMIIVDVENFESENERVKKTDIEIVWNGERNEEGIHARTIHLHPRQVGGAILSLDKMIPDEAWLWAGTSWKKDINKSLVNCLSGVILQSTDPEILCSKWEKALGKERAIGDELTIPLKESNISFIQNDDGRGEGIYAFVLKALDKEKIIENAKKNDAWKDENIYVGGVRIILE